MQNHTFLFSLILILLLSTSCIKNSNIQSKHTHIETSCSEIDLGQVKVNEECLYDLEIKNVGKTPLNLYQVKTSCGCTETEWSRRPVRPGKSCTIKIKYKDKYPGYIHKTLTIYGNIDKPLEVNIKGELIE